MPPIIIFISGYAGTPIDIFKGSGGGITDKGVGILTGASPTPPENIVLGLNLFNGIELAARRRSA
jgi:hypothetical protein